MLVTDKVDHWVVSFSTKHVTGKCGSHEQIHRSTCPVTRHSSASYSIHSVGACIDEHGCSAAV